MIITRPTYQENILLYKDITPITAVCTKSDDLHISYKDSGRYCSLHEWLMDAYSSQTSVTVFYSPYRGFYNDDNSEDLKTFLSWVSGRPGTTFAEAIGTLDDIQKKNTEAKFTVIMENASRLCSNTTMLNESEREAFGRLKSIFSSLNGINRRLVLMLDKSTDIPQFLSENKSLVKVVNIPMPDTLQRKQFISKLCQKASYNGEDLTVLADATTSMNLIEIARIFATIDISNSPKVYDVAEKIKLIKYGKKENPWKTLSEQKLKQLAATLKGVVLGQDEAIDQTVDILINAKYGSGSTRRGGTPPKALLVFGGPTGVGKTQTAKLIAQYLFGSSDCLARIDMNEFSDAHNKARLIGSPPGYVGYGNSGELPRLLQENPFRLILFDEFEKAAKEVLDILLVMIDEGRITSGAGDTYSVENCVIVFTTNLGAERIIRGEEVLLSVREEIKRFVRPEMYGRLEKGIIGFKSLNENIAVGIFNKELADLLKYNLHENNLRIILSDTIVNKFKERVVSNLSIETGGRGIVKAFDNVVDALLSKYKNDNVSENAIISITDIKEVDGREELVGTYKSIKQTPPPNRTSSIIDLEPQDDSSNENTGNTGKRIVLS